MFETERNQSQCNSVLGQSDDITYKNLGLFIEHLKNSDGKGLNVNVT